jgi:hypothetical protein
MKKTKRINGNSMFEFNGNVEIRDLQDYLEVMKKLNYTHVNISYDVGYEGVYFIPYYDRFETDEEYEKRMKNDAYFEETVRITELKELERLKEKYEKGNKN